MRGRDTVVRSLLSAVERMKGAGGAALYEEALAVDALSVKKTPVDTGRLRATHYVAPPVQQGEQVVVELGNGTEYAIYVHERTDVAHAVGEAKFLQNALNERSKGMLERLQKRTRRNLKAGIVMPALDPSVPTAPDLAAAAMAEGEARRRKERVRTKRAERKAARRYAKKQRAVEKRWADAERKLAKREKAIARKTARNEARKAAKQAAREAKKQRKRDAAYTKRWKAAEKTGVRRRGRYRPKKR